jgi:DNA-binding winged helix-turn-helix (wHTH) protein
MRVRFGAHTFDSETRELLRHRKPVHLSPKAFQFLGLLVRSRPRAVSKQQIQDHLWPDVFVSEENLTSLAAEIRKAIGESSRRPRFLRTLYGFGYAFSAGPAEKERSPGSSDYRIAWGEREVPLVEGENILGRDRGATVRINEASVSRRHARIRIEGLVATIEDLDSKNGTFLRGKRIEKSARLSDGDEIVIGLIALFFRNASPEQTTRTATESSRRQR